MNRAWITCSATARGASHVTADVVNQDAQSTACFEVAGFPAVVAAVADGHGGSQHFRSDRGAVMAVHAACDTALDLADRLGTSEPDGVIDLSRQSLSPGILERWREAVLADLAMHPFTRNDETLREVEHAPELAYGTTLLVTVCTTRWSLCLQIGDGDIVAVQADGAAVLPVPHDDQLDGYRTTSLCQSDALQSFRYGMVEQDVLPLKAVLLATDGYGNAQIADPWPPIVASDLARLLSDKGVPWIRNEMHSWVALCASPEGSGDDTTLTIVICDEPDEGTVP